MVEIRSLNQVSNGLYQWVSSAPQWFCRQVAHYTPSAIKEYPITFHTVDRVMSIGILLLVAGGCIFKVCKRFRIEPSVPKQTSPAVPSPQPSVSQPSLDVQPMSAEALKNEILEFYSEFDFENNLRLIIGDIGRHVNRRFEQLLQQLAQVGSGNHELDQVAARLRERYQLFQDMRARRMQLWRLPVTATAAGNISVSAKGNCFYESVATLLSPSVNTLTSTNEEVTLTNATDLRNSVVGWMRRHLDDPELRKQIQNAMWTALMDAHDQQQKLMQSMEVIKKDKEDAYLPELCNQSRTSLHFYQKNAQQFEPLINKWLLLSVPDLNARNEMRQKLNEALMSLDDNNQALSDIIGLPAKTFIVPFNIREQMSGLRKSYEPYRDSCYRAMNDYLDEQAKEGIWAANAEAYAVAQMYECGVDIISVRRDGNIDTPDPNVHNHYHAFPDRLKHLRLKYITNLHHYEPYVEINNGTNTTSS